MHKAKEMREKAKMTREQVAEIMGVSRYTVRYWELKEDALRLDTAIELCKLYGCSLDELAGTGVVDYSAMKLTDKERQRVEDFVEGMRSNER